MAMNPYGMQLNNTVGAQENKLFNQINKKKDNDNNDVFNNNTFGTDVSYSNPNPVKSNNNSQNSVNYTPPMPIQKQPAVYNELAGYNEMAKRTGDQNLNDYAKYNDARNKSLRIGQAKQNVQQATNKQAIAETGLAADYTNKAIQQGKKDYSNPSQLENFDTDFGKFTPSQLQQFNTPQRGYNLNDYDDILERYRQNGSLSGNSGFSLPDRMPSSQSNIDRNLSSQRTAIEARIKQEEERLDSIGKMYDDLLNEYEKRGKSFVEAQKLATNQLSKEYEGRVKDLDELNKFKSSLESKSLSEAESVSGNLNEALAGLDESDTVRGLSALSGPGYNAGRLGLIDSILERESVGQAIKDARGLNEEGKIAQSKKAGALSSYAKAMDESKKSSDKKRQDMEKKIGELLEKKGSSLNENVKKKGEEIQKSLSEGRKALSERKNSYSDLLSQISDPARKAALAEENKKRDLISKELESRRREEDSVKRFEQKNPWSSGLNGRPLSPLWSSNSSTPLLRG